MDNFSTPILSSIRQFSESIPRLHKKLCVLFVQHFTEKFMPYSKLRFASKNNHVVYKNVLFFSLSVAELFLPAQVPGFLIPVLLLL